MSKTLENIINTVTANGMREITVERAEQIAVEYAEACSKASLEKAKSKLVKIADEVKPTAYRTGNWDGRNSDVVIAIGKSGKYYVAFYSEGILDGEKFEDWYYENEYLIDEDITHWMEPDYFKESMTNVDNIVIL